MYFPFLELRKWGKKAAETRRRNCAVLPYISPDFRIISFRIIPKSNTTAANTPQVNIPVYQARTALHTAPDVFYNPKQSITHIR